MSSETIWQRLRRKPFTPFVIKTSDGDRYSVLHPEMIVVSKMSVTVAIYEPDARPGEDLPAREAFLSPLHVTALEDLPPRKSNGQRRRK